MKKKTTKKKMTTELPPQDYEVRGTDAMALLGYEYLASVRKLMTLGEIEGRKIGRDWWYDRRTIDAYNERRRPVGRRPIEDADDEGTERAYQRNYKRDLRAGKGPRRAATKKAKRAAKPAAGKGGRASKGARKSSAGAAARGGAGAAKKSGAARKRAGGKGRR